MIMVHIGMRKCGSATIQTFFDSNDDGLRRLSVDYPRLGRLDRNAHHNFANELKERPDKFSLSAGRVSDLPKYLSASPHQTTVLSSESFAGLRSEGIEQLKEALTSSGQPVRIIMIIRNLIDQAPSTYAQKVRHGRDTADFDAFFTRWRELDRFNPFETAKRWADSFGWDAIRIRMLSSSSLLNGDLIDDVLATMDLDPDAPALRALPRQPRVNESPGWMTLEAVRALFAARSGLSQGHPLARLIEKGVSRQRAKRIGNAAESVAGELGWNADRGRYLTRAQAAPLHEDFMDSLERLNGCVADKLLVQTDFESLGFREREFLPDASHIPASTLMEFYDTLASRLEASEKLAKPS